MESGSATNASMDASFDVSSIIESKVAPLEFAFLLPESSKLEYGIRIFSYGVIAGLGLITNSLSIAVILLGKLHKNWTYCMVMNLSVTDLVLSLNYVMFWLPGVIMDK